MKSISSLLLFVLLTSTILLVSCAKSEEDPDIQIKSIVLSGSNINDGGTTQMTATITPSNATTQELVWSVSNTAIATIDQNGLLTAVANGNVTVIATATDGSEVKGQKLIGVSGISAPVVLVSSIGITGSNITNGGTSQLTATVTPSNATNKMVVWSVSNTAIATIDQNGLLTGLANGNVTVVATATDGSEVVGQKVIEVSVPVVVLVSSITIIGSNITDGNPKQFSAQVLPANATNNAITWSSSDQNIATVSGTGLVAPLTNGSVTITATAQDGSNVSGNLLVNISGSTSVPGITVSTSGAILSAISSAVAGDIINVVGGNYTFNSPISFNRSGQNGNLITLRAHPNNTERPVFNFSSMSESSGNRGINLSGSYWHVKGIDVFKAGDNGMNISGSNNLIEFCTFSENRDTGLQIGSGGSNNTILNCDSYFNADASLENADGFAAKLDCGSGNKFIGCRAWNNLDDGWDGYLRGADNVTTTYENCWAIRNGYLKSGAIGAGDGNGFKTGGSDDKLLKHNAVLKNCVAAGNVYDGFDHNSNRGNITIYNASSYGNGNNYNFSNTNPAASLIIKNSVSLSGTSANNLNATTTDIGFNGWQNGLITNSADFVSVNIDLLLAARQADGSLPIVTFMHLVNGSDLIDAGTNVGLPFNGAAPDLGAFEK